MTPRGNRAGSSPDLPPLALGHPVIPFECVGVGLGKQKRPENHARPRWIAEFPLSARLSLTLAFVVVGTLADLQAAFV